MHRSQGEEGLLLDGLMRRLVKEQLVHADGSALFPQRHAQTVAYRLSPREYDLYESVTEYVRHEMNKIAGEERRTVGFALLALQRRLASSPEAILRSLIRRRDRLGVELDRVRSADDRLLRALEASLGERPEADAFTAEEEERWDETASAVATASRSAAELETEVSILGQLVDQATAVRDANLDSKWDALAKLLGSEAMFDEDGARRKIIIFTEHRDTLEYLIDLLQQQLGREYDIETIHGGSTRDERLETQRRFRESGRSAVLVATDAAGEGVNLQAAHLMVNYDIPWNPNRLEQRFGRVHRIGQRHECHLWNLVTADTREGDVFATLLAKLERQRNTLGDCVFDVLGDVLRETNLSDLLISALGGSRRTELTAFDENLRAAVERRNSVHSNFTPDEIASLRRRMALARARSLNPLAVRGFVVDSLLTLQGDITRTAAGWTVKHVPARVRAENPAVRTRYSDVEFEPMTDAAREFGPRELLAPGHPLVTALAATVVGEFGESLRHGVVLEDDRSDTSGVVIWLRRGPGLQTAVSVLCPVEATSDPIAINPAALSALAIATSSATDTEVQAVADAIDRVVGDGDEILTVAYVRGTATADVATQWRAARDSLRAGADDAHSDTLLHDPWDLMVERESAWEFVRACPAGVSERIRRHERGAEQSLRDAYRVEHIHLD